MSDDSMNHEARHSELREIGWRRPLSDAEATELRALVAEHPELRTDWLLEQRLSQSLRRLGDAPVASNFTARVVQAIQREAAPRPRRPWRLDWRPLGWIPRIAVVAALAGVTLFTARHARLESRLQLARGIERLARIPQHPTPEILLNYDSIQLMSKATANPSVAKADAELLSLLK